MVSVADVNVSQLAGTEFEVSFSPIASTRGSSDQPQGLAGNSYCRDFSRALELIRDQACLQSIFCGVSARADEAWSSAGVAREVAQGGSHFQRSGTRVTRGGCRRLAAKIRHADGAFRWCGGRQIGCSDGLDRTAVLLWYYGAVAAFGTRANLHRVHDPMHRRLPDGISHSSSSYLGTYHTVCCMSMSAYLQIDPEARSSMSFRSSCPACSTRPGIMMVPGRC